LAFSTDINYRKQSEVIDQIALSTSRVRRLLSLPTAHDVAISSRLKLVAYVDYKESPRVRIVIRPLSGGHPRPVPGAIGNDVWPLFWTNGDQLVYWNGTDLFASLRGATKPASLARHADLGVYTDDPHVAP
jgi:hypothetical protein